MLYKKLSQEALHQYSKRYSHKKLSIDPQKDDLQETIAILFILSSSMSLNPFLGQLTHF